jgi:hypothetical protein
VAFFFTLATKTLRNTKNIFIFRGHWALEKLLKSKINNLCSEINWFSNPTLFLRPLLKGFGVTHTLNKIHSLRAKDYLPIIKILRGTLAFHLICFYNNQTSTRFLLTS